MEDPDGVWDGMAAFLRALPATLPERPRAIVMVSGHWETSGFATTSHARPPLVFDYYGFPPHTYALRYDAPGDPALADQVVELLRAADFDASVNPQRGLDHGVFVPLKVMFPDADVPVVELSLDRGLDAELHLELGNALSSLRDDNVLILGAGMSFHNLRAYGDPRAFEPSIRFDDWLRDAVERPGAERAARLQHWRDAPDARLAHPRHEHLLPLMVAAGTSDAPGRRVYSECVLGAMIAGFRFD